MSHLHRNHLAQAALAVAGEVAKAVLPKESALVDAVEALSEEVIGGIAPTTTRARKKKSAAKKKSRR